MRYNMVVIGLLFLLLPCVAHGGLPMETVQDGVNRVLAVASDPNLKGEDGRSSKIEKIKAITDEFFDYTILSRLTLGRNWNKLSTAQQDEFVSLYRMLLEKIYMGRVLAYSDEKVEFVKEISLSETKSEVQTLIVTSTNQIPIDYRLYNRNGAWRVYDVVIEGVSMVKNYRGQFESILTKQSPQGLIEVLRQKVNES